MRLSLGGFLLASCACHALLFAAWQAPTLGDRPPGGPLAVRLSATLDTPARRDAPAQPAPSAAPAPAPRAPVTPSAAPAARQSANTKAKPVAQASVAQRPADTAPESLPSAAPSSAASAASNLEEARAYVRARIDQDLGRYFFYPMLARRRGWEGDVLLAFRVTPDGAIDDVQVIASSGYAVLDRSALEALRKIKRLAGVAERLRGRAVDMQLPVIYRLEG